MVIWVGIILLQSKNPLQLDSYSILVYSVLVYSVLLFTYTFACINSHNLLHDKCVNLLLLSLFYSIKTDTENLSDLSKVAWLHGKTCFLSLGSSSFFQDTTSGLACKVRN